MCSSNAKDSGCRLGAVNVVTATKQDHVEDPFGEEQMNDPDVKEIIDLLDNKKAWRIALQESLFGVVDGILYFVNPKHNNRKRVVMPRQLQEQILKNFHASLYGGHFSGPRLYNALVSHWWWEGMFSDALKFAKSCPECAIVTGGRRVNKPLFHPIPMSRTFQIQEIDVMDLPLTDQGNKHAVVIQHLFTKWPLVFAVLD